MSEDPTEPDRIPTRLIAVIAAGTVAAIAASAVAVWLLAGERARGGGERPPTEVPPAEVHALDTPPFGAELATERARRAQREQLDRGLPAAIDRYLATHGGGAR